MANKIWYNSIISIIVGIPESSQPILTIVMQYYIHYKTILIDMLEILVKFTIDGTSLT